MIFAGIRSQTPRVFERLFGAHETRRCVIETNQVHLAVHPREQTMSKEKRRIELNCPV